MKKRFTGTLGALLIIVSIINIIPLAGNNKVSILGIIENICFFVAGTLFLLSWLKDKKKNKRR